MILLDFYSCPSNLLNIPKLVSKMNQHLSLCIGISQNNVVKKATTHQQFLPTLFVLNARVQIQTRVHRRDKKSSFSQQQEIKYFKKQETRYLMMYR